MSTGIGTSTSTEGITGSEQSLIPVDPADTKDLLLVTCIRYDPVLLEDHDWHSTKSGGPSKSPYLLLPFHVDRLRTAAQAFGWTHAAEMLSRPDAPQWLESQCEIALAGATAATKPNSSTKRAPATVPTDKACYKIRCLLGPDGQLEIQLEAVSTRPFDLLGAPYMTPAYLHPLTPTTLMTWPTAYAPILSVFVDKAPTLIQGTSYYKHTNRDAYQAARDRIGITDKDAVDEVLLWNEAGEILEGSRRTISVWRDGSWVTPPLSSGCMDGSIRRWMLSTKKVREARVLKEDLRGGEWVLTSNGIEGCCFGKFVAMDREAYKNALRDNAPLPNHSTIDYYPDRNR